MDKIETLISQLMTSGVDLGKRLLAAVVIYFIGRYAIKLIKRLMKSVMDRKSFDPAVKTFFESLVSISLTILLLIAVIGTLGIETTSFAALLASAGVAVGMALSGNLQNFAGGLMVLLFKPYKIGDVIETNGKIGSVKEIQIFNTILVTPDNRTIFIPNGSIISGVLENYSHQEIRRVDWSFGVEYGTDYAKVKECVIRTLSADARILKDPAIFVALGELADSSVNVTVRAWVKSADYWDVFFDINQVIYETFNKEGIEFPFPQLTVHQAKK